MNKKYIIAFTVIILILIVTVFFVQNRAKTEKVDAGFVFDKSSGIKLKDIEAYYHSVDFNEENAKDYFKDKIINPYTLKFLMFLDNNFKEFNNKKDLFENVRKYLYSIMSADMADQFLDLYKKYISYQSSLGEKARIWGKPKTIEDTVDFLHKLQDYRREVFGKEIADALFGASVMAEEYPLRRGAILGDKNMYGVEKEKKLQQLNADMWGEEANKVDSYADPYTKYKEKLALYEKDMSEMNEEEKKAQIRSIREQFYTKDQIQSMEEVDKAIEDNESRERDYKARELEITNDPNMDKTEKENKVRELQNQMYGDEADALRRRLAIERASETAIKK